MGVAIAIAAWNGTVVHIATGAFSASAFLQRYRQHIPPPRFVRVRFWGLMANRKRKEHSKRFTTALKEAPPPPSGLAQPYRHTPATPADKTNHQLGMTCPKCGAKGTYGYIGHHHRTKDYNDMSEYLGRKHHGNLWQPPDQPATEETVIQDLAT